MCYTSVVIDGDKEKLKELVELLESLDGELGFDSVLEKRGVDTSELNYDIRGWIEDFYFNEDEENPRIDLQLESKWGISEDALYDMFQFRDEEDEYILNLYYSFEVEGFLEFGTNDWEKKYFKNRYFVYEPDFGDDYNYYETEEEVIDHLKRHLPDLKVEDLEDEESVNEQLKDKLGEDTEIEYHKYWVD